MWIGGTHTLWYRVSTAGGYRFVRVDADLMDRAVSQGERAGRELEERQRDRKASANPSVQAVVRRFDGSVTEVEELGSSDGRGTPGAGAAAGSIGIAD